MQIMILRASGKGVSNFSISKAGMIALISALMVSIFLLAIGFQYLTLRFMPDAPVVSLLIDSAVSDRVAENEKNAKQNIAAMVVRLGELQAQIVRLESLGERVQKLADIKTTDFDLKSKPGRGGPQTGGTNWTPEQFQSMLNSVAGDMVSMDDYLSIAESNLMSQKIQANWVHGSDPVNIAILMSGFGIRSDPFSGLKAFHRGLDFAAPIGTPVFASASGKVVVAERHPEYGNMIDIDHGRGVMSRYAHTSKMLVKVGAVVKRGDQIAEVGTTGRSTGPHLHFEVMVNGVVQNPVSFLSRKSNDRKKVSSFAKLAN